MADRRDFIKKRPVLTGRGWRAQCLTVTSYQPPKKWCRESFLLLHQLLVCPILPYAYDALEPYMTGKLWRYHGRHHKAYVEKLNGADLSSLNLALSDADNCKIISNSSPAIIRNNLGGHFNHSLSGNYLKPIQLAR